MTEMPEDDDVLLTEAQGRKAAREAKRQAKDDAYEERLARKKSKDVHFIHGHHIIDASGLAAAFPEPEDPAIHPAVVRRRIIHGITLVLLLAMVAAAVVLVGMIQRGEVELKLDFPKTAAVVSCPPATVEYLANNLITVNVYNFNAPEGTAGKVAAELTLRGYKVNEVANRAVDLIAPAVIISGPAGHSAAFNLQQNIAGTDYLEDGRLDGSVDVVLTGSFLGLVEAAKVSEVPGTLSCPRLNPAAAKAPLGTPPPTKAP